MKINSFILICITLIFSCEKNKGDAVLNTNTIVSASYKKLNPSQKIKFLDSISPLVSNKQIDSKDLTFLFDISAEYYYLKKTQKSLAISKKIQAFTKQAKDSLNLGRALYYMGDCYIEINKDSAFYYYKEAEKIFALLNNKDRLAKIYFNKAYLLFYEGNYIESESEIIKALNQLKYLKNYELEYMCYSLQGSNHTELEEYDKALTYYNLATEALVKLNKIQKPNEEYYYINSIDKCNIYDKKGWYDKSIFELSKICNPVLKQKNLYLYSTVLGNLAYAHMKKGNYALANKYFTEALSLTKNAKYTHSYLYKAINYGEYLYLTHQNDRAKHILQEAVLIARKIKNNKELLKSLDLLAKIDKKNSSHYKSLYIKINDSLIKKQRINRNKFARIEYETTLIEEKNKVLSKNNFFLLLSIALSIIIFLCVTLLFYRKAKTKEIKLIKERNTASEELVELINTFQESIVKAKLIEQERIAKELHDGIMNQLYGVRLKLGLLNENKTDEGVEKRVRYIKELQKIETEIRAISHDLKNDTSLQLTDFAFLIHNLIATNNEYNTTTFTCELSNDINWNQYSSTSKLNIYRIIQEAFLNVNKHANAAHCSLKVKEKAGELLVTIADDGIGFDKNSIKSGIGIANIIDRAKNCNAIITIDSSVKNGTVLAFRLKKQIIATN